MYQQSKILLIQRFISQFKLQGMQIAITSLKLLQSSKKLAKPKSNFSNSSTLNYTIKHKYVKFKYSIFKRERSHGNQARIIWFGTFLAGLESFQCVKFVLLPLCHRKIKEWRLAACLFINLSIHVINIVAWMMTLYFIQTNTKHCIFVVYFWYLTGIPW